MMEVNFRSSGTLISFNAREPSRGIANSFNAREHKYACTRARTDVREHTGHARSLELTRTHAGEQTRAMRELMRAQPSIHQETHFRSPHSRTPRSTRKHMRANTRVR